MKIGNEISRGEGEGDRKRGAEGGGGDPEMTCQPRGAGHDGRRQNRVHPKCACAYRFKCTYRILQTVIMLNAK